MDEKNKLIQPNYVFDLTNVIWNTILIHITTFRYPSLIVDTFQKIRVYFVQALEEEQVSQGVCEMELIETATIPTKFEDGLERSLALVEELEREHKKVKLSIARRIVNPASTLSIASSLEKGCVLKIKGEYIPRYQEFELTTS